MSASSTPTVCPADASAAARLTVTELLPTPPLPLAMASTLHDTGTSVSGAFSRAFQRALVITWRAFVGVHLAPRDLHRGDAGVQPRRRVSISRLDLGAQRTAADRELEPTVTSPSGATVDRRHHAERDDVGAEFRDR